jgi:hypothetical protein
VAFLQEVEFRLTLSILTEVERFFRQGEERRREGGERHGYCCRASVFSHGRGGRLREEGEREVRVEEPPLSAQ